MKLPRCQLAVTCLVGATAFAPAGTNAQAQAPAGANVIDGRAFHLNDGRKVRLAAIEVPAVDSDEQAAVTAKAALEALTLHHAVSLQLSRSAPDRYGRLVAYVFVAAPEGERFVQQALLSAGNALLSPVGLAPQCRTFLRGAEQTARAAKLGLWADPEYGARQADDPDDVLAHQGRFTLAAGKVASVRESAGIVYVNFGRVASHRFTVTILKRKERWFSGAGMAPTKLAGRRVEVRGWIEERNGLAIEVVRPEQIELVD